MNNPHRSGPGTAPVVLDPRQLGRPVHLLPHFTAQWRDDLQASLRSGMNRRYRASFQVGDVTLDRVNAPAGSGRWLGYASAAGQIGFSIERPLLLALLNYRYGVRSSPPPAAPSATTLDEAEQAALTHGDSAPPAPPPARPPSDAPVRETATEERLAESLGLQWATALASCIEALAAPSRPAALPAPGFTATVVPPPGAGCWTVGVAIGEPTLDLQARMWFTLDNAWMARLFANLAPARDKARSVLAEAPPLTTLLRLTLVGRLLHRETSLGELLDLKIGDVLPVRLGATDVLVDDSLLFTGTLAENEGRLCLTAFKDLE
jgi:flagellar motor switch protein FliM